MLYFFPFHAYSDSQDYQRVLFDAMVFQLFHYGSNMIVDYGYCGGVIAFHVWPALSHLCIAPIARNGRSLFELK